MRNKDDQLVVVKIGGKTYKLKETMLMPDVDAAAVWLQLDERENGWGMRFSTPEQRRRILGT